MPENALIRCSLCDYYAGQVENLPTYKDKQIHRELDHDGKIFRWFEL